MINELDIVALTRAIPEEKLEAGDTGTVVMVHEGGKGFEVEFMTMTGETIGVVTLEAKDIRPIRASEIAHAREVA